MMYIVTEYASNGEMFGNCLLFNPTLLCRKISSSD